MNVRMNFGHGGEMKQAAVNLIIKDGLILAISRRHDKTKYGLPGGKVSPDETPEQAAKREAWEETGIQIKECIFIFKRVELGDGANQVDFESYTYYATDWSGEPHDSEEGNVRWLTSVELTDTKAAFGDYNRNMLNQFKQLFPNVNLIGELCPGGCNNTGWQSGDNEGFICDLCDRACVCDERGRAPQCLIHQGE